jgi:hypothetical protein
MHTQTHADVMCQARWKFVSESAMLGPRCCCKVISSCLMHLPFSCLGETWLFGRHPIEVDLGGGGKQEDGVPWRVSTPPAET